MLAQHIMQMIYENFLFVRVFLQLHSLSVDL